jgi:branched-chain amino acid aminotransferase
MVTYLDGRFVEDRDATISVRSRALNYGIGCFGGIRGYLSDDGKQVYVFRLDQHVARLDVSSRMLKLSLTVEPARLKEIIVELLRRNDVHHDVYIRPMVFSGSIELSPVLKPEDSSLTVYCMPLKRYIDKESINVCISSWRRVSDNAVSEGSAEHIFIVRDGELISPPSTEDNLDGITRRSLIAMATEDLGLTVKERVIGRTELYVAEEIFLCGTGAEVTPVGSVDRRLLGNGKPGPITQRVKQQFDNVVHGRVEHRKSWLTPVWE